ncbi:MAG: hypothetical protein RLZZ618_759 [Pseudomonadota bacterium]|jgi:hypothetical protein
MELKNRHDAYRLLQELGAPTHLIRHLQLVGEAADELMAELQKLELKFDSFLVELGAAVHDAGKIMHPSELHSPGSLHEPAGQALLLSHGVQANVARCCITHADWARSDVSFEERLVALADKLWKGKREPELELLVVDGAALLLGRDRWDLFTQLDAGFEVIASRGSDRLERSLTT